MYDNAESSNDEELNRPVPEKSEKSPQRSASSDQQHDLEQFPNMGGVKEDYSAQKEVEHRLFGSESFCLDDENHECDVPVGEEGRWLLEWKTKLILSESLSRYSNITCCSP
jgi:hypothetical protein